MRGKKVLGKLRAQSPSSGSRAGIDVRQGFGFALQLWPEDGAMLEDNKDICPDVDFVRTHPLVEPAICNALVRKHFKDYEDKATAARARYVFWGRAALGCVVSAALYTVAEALVFQMLPNGYVPLDIWGALFAIVAAFGIAAYAALYWSRTKFKWLQNRFAAERIRSINFQALALAPEAVNTEDLAEKVEAFTERELALLRQEINAAGAHLRSFKARKAIARIPAPAPIRNAALQEQAADSYRVLRILYQQAFADDELGRVQTSRRYSFVASDMAYLVGAIGSFLALALKWHSAGHSNAAAILDAIVVFSFIIGLCLAHYENVSLSEETEARFGDYIERLKEAEASPTFHEEIKATELAAMDELKNFCAAADRVSFRM